MQRFPCPFCGLRDETEFFYSGEAGHPRPYPSQISTAPAWAAYLYHNYNAKGPSREVWVHLTCGEYFLLERDTVTHAVKGSYPLTMGLP